MAADPEEELRLQSIITDAEYDLRILARHKRGFNKLTDGELMIIHEALRSYVVRIKTLAQMQLDGLPPNPGWFIEEYNYLIVAFNRFHTTIEQTLSRLLPTADSIDVPVKVLTILELCKVYAGIGNKILRLHIPQLTSVLTDEVTEAMADLWTRANHLFLHDSRVQAASSSACLRCLYSS
jgi:hypothetical protein